MALLFTAVDRAATIGSGHSSRLSTDAACETAQSKLTPYRLTGGAGKLRGVNRGVRLHLVQLDDGSPIQPGNDHFVGNFDAGKIAIVGVIDLHRREADRR